MGKVSRWLSAILSAALIIPTLVPGMVQAAPAAGTVAVADSAAAADVAGHWAKSSILRWQRYNLIHGYPDHTFKPDHPVTRAEFASILNNLFGFQTKSETAFADVPSTSWYADILSIARQAGYFSGLPGNLAQPDKTVSREDAAVMLAKAFEMSKEESGSSSLPFTDVSRIHDSALSSVRALSAIISGYPDGTFRPDKEISRGELLTLIDKLVKAYYPEEGTFKGGDIQGNAIINHGGVVLSDAVISGNLYLGPGIGDHDVTLRNVTVKGMTFISGGGEHSVTLDASNLNEVRVNRVGGRSQVATQGATRIEHLLVNSPSTLEFGDGTSITDAELNQPAALRLSDHAVIASLVINEGAAGTSISGKGTVTKAVIRGTGVTVNGAAVGAGTVNITGGVASSSGSSSGGTGGTGGGSVDTIPVIDLVDKDATDRTKSLFVYLNQIRGNHILFGQQHATDEGLSITKHDGTESDTFNDVGAYPAMFGWDTLSLEGYEKPGVMGDFAKSRDNLIDVMKKAYKYGGVLTLSSHMPNFVTGDDFRITKGNVVSHILPGGDKNAEFNTYLDHIADFANNLKDDGGNSIPVIYRPFHEQNGSWFWWGAAFTTSDEYKEIYRYTVEYLRDKKGVRNFLYAYSPGGGFGESESEYLKTYPGDDYVDILGFDSYYNGEGASWFSGVTTEAKTISKLADKKGKVAALTEFGYQEMKVKGNATTDFFTRLASALKSDSDAKRMAFMLTWANFGPYAYVPYHTGDAANDHEMLPDFIKFYQDSYTLFSDGVYGAYNKKARTEAENGFMHIVSPTDQGTIKEATTKIRVRVLNETVSKVVYSTGDAGIEMPLTLDSSSGYYTADWSPAAALNGKSTKFTVTVYGQNDQVLQRQTNTVFVKINEVLINAYTFDSHIDGVQYNGEYSNSLESTQNGSIAHSSFNGGSLQITASKLTSGDTWQEMKLELKNAETMAGSDLTQVKRIKMDVWVPVSIGTASGASLRAVGQLPPDWTTKYGMDTTYTSFAALPTVTVNGAVYAKFSPTIDFNDAKLLSAADDIALSIVGSGLDTGSDTFSLYVDNIRMYNTYTEASADPAFVDDFEGYLGSNEALAAKIVHAGGDEATASLDDKHKNGGSYGLKYTYTLAIKGYTGVTKAMGGADWSGYNALQFWYEPDGKGQKLVIQINAGGKTYEYYPDTTTTTAAFITAPFNAFAPANGATGTLTKSLLKNVQAFSIYTNAKPNGTMLTSSMYFDDIRAVSNPDAGVVPDGSSDDNGLPLGTLFGFTDSIDGWILNANDMGLANLKHTSDGDNGVLSVDLPAGTPVDSEGKPLKGQVVYQHDLDLSKGSSLKVRMKVSTGTVKAKLFVQTGSGWKWADSGEITLTSDYQWITLNLGGIDKSAIKAIGVEFNSPSGAGTVYMDDLTQE
ncbi:glycosyl hydrolase [Gorillibacterium massiliense]|uniref:glycosyl hydrolase n=1 Tax=Gorillibacterium massiliense TaxID=1280390 RepID=UPI0004AF2B4C|nr:glycosyl hydrolase [Gorillibacterium massiliense]